MKNNLCLILIFIFHLTFSQTPSVSKNYSFDNTIDAFIKLNNDENFKPNLSIIFITSMSYNEEEYLISILRDNIESLINPLSPNLEYYKYDGFDLVLHGIKSDDIEFLKKIIKKKVISKSSLIKFKEPIKNVTYDPYEWYFIFDKKMKLKDYTLPGTDAEIETIIKEYNIK